MSTTTLRKKLHARRVKLRKQGRRWRKTRKRGYAKAAHETAKAVRFLEDLLRKSLRLKWISKQGAEFIATFEGCSLVPYMGPVGDATVGIGHLLGIRPLLASDSWAKWVKGQKTPGKLTPDEAIRLLRTDLRKTYEPPVRALFQKGGSLHGQYDQALYDALVSAVYNLGTGAVSGVPGFETLGAAIRSGDVGDIADALLLYDKAGGKAFAGLTRRRQCERRLILTGSYRTVI